MEVCPVNEEIEVSRRVRSVDTLNQILEEVLRNDVTHEVGFPSTRDGVRLGLARVQDEIDMARESYLLYQLTSNWAPARQSLVIAAAQIVRICREIA